MTTEPLEVIDIASCNLYDFVKTNYGLSIQFQLDEASAFAERLLNRQFIQDTALSGLIIHRNKTGLAPDPSILSALEISGSRYDRMLPINLEPDVIGIDLSPFPPDDGLFRCIGANVVKLESGILYYGLNMPKFVRK